MKFELKRQKSSGPGGTTRLVNLNTFPVLVSLTRHEWSDDVLTAAKAIIGVSTGSLAILSEAGHSLLDLSATGANGRAKWPTLLDKGSGTVCRVISRPESVGPLEHNHHAAVDR